MLIAAVAFEYFAALAVMVAVPVDTPVTGTRALVESALMLTVGGTAATSGLLDVSFTTKPLEGAGAGSNSVRLCVDVPLIIRLAGEKLIAAAEPNVTCTTWLVDAKPNADAVMVADPAPRPSTSGTTLDFIALCGMITAVGITVTVEVSLLFSVTYTLPVGAATDNVTGNATDSLRPTFTFAGRRMVPPVPGPADAVIVTAAGLLFVNPLLTMSCTT
jgi:hypothetical protein